MALEDQEDFFNVDHVPLGLETNTGAAVSIISESLTFQS